VALENNFALDFTADQKKLDYSADLSVSKFILLKSKCSLITELCIVKLHSLIRCFFSVAQILWYCLRWMKHCLQNWYNWVYIYVVCSTEYWAGDDIMDSETAAAFELFMAESRQASSSSRTVVPNCHREVTSSQPWSPTDWPAILPLFCSPVTAVFAAGDRGIMRLYTRIIFRIVGNLAHCLANHA